MEYIASISYGKDSLAMLEVISRNHLPLDRIVHVEIMATPSIPADLPPMMEFKSKADQIIKQRYGVEVEHLCAPKSYEEYFYSPIRRKSSKNYGRIYGFPLQRGNWCNGRLKVEVIDKIQHGGIAYIGIAADEPKRFSIMSETKRCPLVEYGWTEKMCWEWCSANNLLSPIYETSFRGGCWFCHNQGVDQLRILRKKYPDYWALLMRWDKDSPVAFKASGHTIHDFDLRFQMEEQGEIRPDIPFRWSMVIARK